MRVFFGELDISSTLADTMSESGTSFSIDQTVFDIVLPSFVCLIDVALHCFMSVQWQCQFKWTKYLLSSFFICPTRGVS